MLKKTSDITLAINTLLGEGYVINEDGTIAPPAGVVEATQQRLEVLRQNLVKAREARTAKMERRVAVVRNIRNYNPNATALDIGYALGVSDKTIYNDLKKI